MKVVVDNNLPLSLATLMRSSGMNAVHVLEVKLADASDDELRRQFQNDGIIFVTRDNDFWLNRPSSWCVVWIALHNPKLFELKGSVLKTLARLIPTLAPGQRVLIAADQIRFFI